MIEISDEIQNKKNINYINKINILTSALILFFCGNPLRKIGLKFLESLAKSGVCTIVHIDAEILSIKITHKLINTI
jgi:hypothetical protein